jgi:hypothetical protein
VRPLTIARPGTGKSGGRAGNTPYQKAIVEDRALSGNPRVSEDPTVRSAQPRFASGLDASRIH